ncbi:MAG: EamA family transporter RarD [Hamadaea sp.]|uniref:EamA family transporter RarD n=1 Tax=Hamadaea sp. TaxID=2024425 RepID=UPI00180ECB5C|nr:EamA family transporter RarD [Hamadaea sp.]NUR73288.1 EamA family transporter RarD [Hamadaea sp.]NUT19398.1 EamA family transporter RarD [Hamadaea sp.]
MNEVRRGYLLGLGAYVMWGFFPLYFKHLQAAGAVEILAHRVVWSLATVAIIITVLRRWRAVAALRREPKRLAAMALAAVLIGLNWGTYIYGVNSSRVVETALGYFITPLVVIMLGVGVLHERLRRGQWLAVAVGVISVVVLTVDYGRLPWIALTLACSFGLYGLVKKRVGLPPADGLLLESATLALPALIYLATLRHGSFGTAGGVHTFLLVFSGLATVVPLLLFAGAANRIPLYGIGMLQYVGPIIQFGLGVFWFHEPMPTARWIGFALVWLALGIFTFDSFAQLSRQRSLALQAQQGPA